jgi:hypothetical protein
MIFGSNKLQDRERFRLLRSFDSVLLLQSDQQSSQETEKSYSRTRTFIKKRAMGEETRKLNHKKRKISDLSQIEENIQDLKPIKSPTIETTSSKFAEYLERLPQATICGKSKEQLLRFEPKTRVSNYKFNFLPLIRFFHLQRS